MKDFQNRNHDDDDDRFWMESIRGGDEESFEFLFKKYYLPLTRFAWRHVGSKAIAEELVQELFTILWEQKGDWIATEVESLIYESIPNIRHIHVHYHPAEDERRDMSIDDILAETRKHVAAHESYYEYSGVNVSQR